MRLTNSATDYPTLAVPRIYGPDLLTGRHVKWLANVQKRFLDPIILDIVARPNAFVSLPRSVRRGLYDLVYPSYIADGEFVARFNVTDEKFSSYDELLLQTFVNFIASNTKAINEDSTVKGFEQAAFADAGEYSPHLRTDISSPGFFSLSSLRTTPLVVAALLTAAVEIGPTAVQAVENGTFRIGNTAGPPDDPCVADVQQQATLQIQLLGLDRWAEACEKAKRASDGTGLKMPTRVRGK